MDAKDKILIQNRYKNRLNDFGPGIQALASGTDERREIRFNVLSEIGIKDGDSILDVGCGFADFFSHLNKLGINVEYTGIDIVPELIDCAREAYPNLNLEVRDLQENPFASSSFDYVVSSQVFNYNFGEGKNYDLAKDMMSIMFEIAKHGVAIDFISSYVDFREERLHYFEPEKIFSFAKGLTRRVTLRHDYPLFEFCIYMYPNFNGWSNK